MATPNYDINYDDKRFTAVESDKKAALNEVDVTYGNMINSADSHYQKQIDAAQDYADEQSKLQQQQTDFAIDKIEQQKEQTQKDYIKEQSGAYVDWQKQSNKYGVNAEQQAAAGLTNSGYSESSLVSMYNTYQNRVATARDVFNRAVLDYDNQMTEARLQNSSILAEIAYNALQKRLELSLAGFQYKNTLLLEQANKKLEVEQMYHDRWQDVLAQINTENALAEEVRQYNEKLAEEKRQYDQTHTLQQEQLKLQQDEFAWQKAQAAAKASSGSSSTKKSSTSSGKKKSTGSSTTKKSSGKVVETTSVNNSTYSKAAAKMQKAGATTGDGGLMTRTEWLRRKNSGSNRAEFAYATYNDYVNSFTNWRIANPEK
jgi:hypothetical protein